MLKHPMIMEEFLELNFFQQSGGHSGIDHNTQTLANNAQATNTQVVRWYLSAMSVLKGCCSRVAFRSSDKGVARVEWVIPYVYG